MIFHLEIRFDLYIPIRAFQSPVSQIRTLKTETVLMETKIESLD